MRLLLEATTIEQMAHLLEAALQPETIRGAAAPALDLAAEGVLDPAIRLADTPSAELEAQPGRILLTGATGFLGSFLFATSYGRPGRRSTAWCGRRTWRGRVREVAAQAGGAGPVGGKRPKRGLSRCSATWPSRGPWAGPSAVPSPGGNGWRDYHSGALGQLRVPYAALRTANVLGTQEVLRLACAGRLKSLHYVSTTHIFFLQAFAGANVREGDHLGTGFNLYDGYGQSKWVAEKLVWEARPGLPTPIYRPGVITGDSQTGVANTDDFMHRIIKGCLELGLVPDIDTEVDMTPVDFVSSAIVALSQERNCLGWAFHLINPQPLVWHDVVAWAVDRPATRWRWCLTRSGRPRWLDWPSTPATTVGLPWRRCSAAGRQRWA